MTADTLADLLSALRDPAVYPHPAGDVTVIETHVSVVFLAGEYAYKLKKPLDTVIEAVRLIESLEPRPGRNYFSDNTQYITPDIYAFKVESEWVIVLNEDDIPRLTISSYCRRILDEKGGMNAEEKGYLSDR